MRRRLLAVLLVSAIVLLSGCGITWNKQPKPPTRLTVDAATSLRNPMRHIKAKFESAHPGVRVRFRFADDSATLAGSIANGSAAGVFASGAPADMRQVVAAGHAETPVDFASNTMEIVVPKGNPAGVVAVADLGKPGVKVAVCDPRTPCGADATAVFAKAKVTVRGTLPEMTAADVVDAVRTGKADAGVVFTSDAARGSDVDTVVIPANLNVVTEYQIAVLTDATHPKQAQAFVDYVTSDSGKTVLDDAGYAPPVE